MILVMMSLSIDSGYSEAYAGGLKAHQRAYQVGTLRAYADIHFGPIQRGLEGHVAHIQVDRRPFLRVSTIRRDWSRRPILVYLRDRRVI